MTINLNGKRHPQGKSLSEALRDDEDAAKQQRKKGISKRATLIKDPDVSSEDLGIGATMCPTEEQLERINKFTRKTVTKDEVVCFPTLSMNDIPDRDDDVFTTDTVKEFAELEAPFSSVGKSYMADHDYTIAKANGRIFGVGVQKEGSNLYLTNEVYIPNTPQFSNFIEKIDFGINWAVSVGVMLGKTECSLSFCKAPFSSWGWWCQSGHDKGMYYTEDAEEDSWGFPIPSDPKASGAQKCLRNFKEAKDFYELSQVFLGAQYNAAISEKGILAACKSAGVPLLGLSEDEASDIAFKRLPPKVAEAYQKGLQVETGEDGVMTWKDSDRRVWAFDPNDASSGVLNLGTEPESNDDNEEEVEDGSELERGPEGHDDSGNELPSGEPSASAGSDSDEDHTSSDGSEPSSEQGSIEPDTSTNEGEEENDMPKESVLAAARKAGLPNEVVRAASDGQGNGLEALLLASNTRMTALEKEVGDLRPKAAMGDEYVADLRNQALEAYIAARAGGDRPVDTERFEKILDRCSGDVDLLKGLIEENQTDAKANFPTSVRRSSFPSDANERKNSNSDEVKAEGADVSDGRVQRLHPA